MKKRFLRKTMNMRIDGKKIRDRIKGEVRQTLSEKALNLGLAIVLVGEDPVVRGFVNLKKKFAEDVGVRVTEIALPQDTTFAEITEVMQKLNADSLVSGIIIQLPLPAHLDTDAVLDLIEPEKDVDVLARSSVERFERGESVVVPPVAGAVLEICREAGVAVQGKRILVVGHGRLVGAPTATLLRNLGAEVSVIAGPTDDLAEKVRAAEVVILGAGAPNLVTPDMVTANTVLIDAGTSEQGGVVVGDADPRCEAVARVFTPVPGGVGPVTVAMIFRNLLKLQGKTRD